MGVWVAMALLAVVREGPALCMSWPGKLGVGHGCRKLLASSCVHHAVYARAQAVAAPPTDSTATAPASEMWSAQVMQGRPSAPR